MTIDLRGLDASEAARRLDLTLGKIGTLDSDCLIFDDLNEIEDGSVRVSFARCIQALRRRDRTAILTCYRSPSQRTLTELGLPGEAVIEIPYLTEAEAGEIVRKAGGKPNKWGKIAHTAGAQGHPQLTHAFVMGMAARGWPTAEMGSVIIRGFASDDTDAERDAARRSLVTALSDDARALLYRLSLIIGHFDRDLALKLGQVAPPIGKSGERLDELIGPWIEVVGRNAYRVSPLASNAGKGMLSADEQQALHEVIAVQMLSHRRISASDANSILMHALLGKSVMSLAALAHSVQSAGPQVTEALQQQFFLLQALPTDRPIFEDNRLVSVMLRTAQFRLLAAKEEAKEIAACVDALFREIAEEQDATLKQAMEALALALILNTIGIASYVPNWVELLQVFRTSSEANPLLQDLKENTADAVSKIGSSFYGAIFSVGSAGLKTVQRLEEILLDLDRLSPTDRSLWLDGSDRNPSDYANLVNSPWFSEHEAKQLDASDAAARYERMSTMALKWGNRPLALQCIAARAVMLDEYIGDETAAHAVIDQAIDTLGEDAILLRERAKLFWRHNEHRQAVDVMRAIEKVVGLDSPIERAFALREAAISAANIDDWQLANEWFSDARKAADQAATDAMRVMALGLRADTAVAALKCGNAKEALAEMAECLAGLKDIDPDSSLRAAYCHRVVRHAVLWMESTLDQRETLLDGKPISILPGTCSNPEPPAAITELPVAPLDLAWYMLADAEISSGVDAGVERSLRSRLENGAIVFMEIAQTHRHIVRDIVNTKTSQFAADLSAYLAGVEYLRVNGPAMKDAFDVMTPIRGAIPTLSPAQLADPNVEGVAVDAILGFGLVAALNHEGDPTKDLNDQLESNFGANFPGMAVIANWQGLQSQLPPLDHTIADLITLLRSGTYLEPSKIWEVGLRAFEKIRQSNFRQALFPILAAWLRTQWHRIIEHEAFRLLRPMVSVPPVEESLARKTNDEAFVASLLLTTGEAVGMSLAESYRQQLKDIAATDS